MKKIIMLTLLSLLFVQYGCESHQREEQQERTYNKHSQEAAPEVIGPERGNINK